MPYSDEDHVSYTRNEYENLPYYKNMFNFLKEKKIESYIDIGANVGEVCNIFFERFPTLQKAFLIEPEVNTFNFLKQNVKKTKNIECYNLAIYYGNDPPYIFKNFNPGGNIISSRQPNHGDFYNSGFIQNYSTLEELKFPIVDLVKIDIEGGEFDLIENSTYIQDINYIEIEFHYAQNSIDILEYIKNKLSNYKIVVVEDILGRFLLERIK